jgi:hypothetical protein
MSSFLRPGIDKDRGRASGRMWGIGRFDRAVSFARYGGVVPGRLRERTRFWLPDRKPSRSRVT